MKRIISLLALLCFFHLLFSQIADVVPTSVSIAQTSVSDSQNWTAFNNPAILGYSEQSEIGFQFANRYLLSELSTKSLQFALPKEIVNTGLSFSHFGYSQYHEMLIGLGFARNFNDKFAMGVQFNYFTSYLAASNSYQGALLPQFGFSVRFSPRFSSAFNVFNPFQTNINTLFVIKRIPSVFSFGTEYFFSPELIWRTQIDKEVSSNYRFATGFDYRMLQHMIVKLGIYNIDYPVPCLGFGFDANSFLFDLNCEIHPLLGLNTSASVRYRFRK